MSKDIGTSTLTSYCDCQCQCGFGCVCGCGVDCDCHIDIKDLVNSDYDKILHSFHNKDYVLFKLMISGNIGQWICYKVMKLICQYGNSKFCQILLKKHKHCNVDYDLSIYDAAMAGNLPVLQTLVKNGVDIHTNGASALWWACNNGHFDVVVYLVTNGIDPNSRKDVLHAASTNSHKKIVDYLTPLLV